MIHPRLGTIRSILCIGSHPDDIEIGCGGTILRLLSVDEPPAVTWIVLSGDTERGREAHRAADSFLEQARRADVRVESFRDSFFPYEGSTLKQYFHGLSEAVSPDLVFTHHTRDRHQDHRLVAELTWNTFRDHLILEYEIPKYDGDLGQPNMFVSLSRETCERKVSSIVQCFPSQREKKWFSDETLWAILRLRGIESAAESRYAEAFHCRKMVF